MPTSSSSGRIFLDRLVRGLFDFIFLRSSPLFVMKRPIPKSSSLSVSEPLLAKPTRGELQSRLEVLVKKKKSVKRKPSNSPEGCPSAQGKTLKVGASPSPSSVVGAGDSSGRVDEPPLEVSLSRSRVLRRGALLPLIQYRTK